jgi:prophage maintenance system killer protein
MAHDKNKIMLLEIEHLIDVNDMICQKSKEQKEIVYSGNDVYPIQLKKLRVLIENTPKEDVLTIATYYLKNIILLQPFPDGNHRTALASVELFLDKNGYDFNYSVEDAVKLQKDAYNIRLKVYGHYDQHDISIITHSEDDFTNLCKTFLNSRLTKRD